MQSREEWERDDLLALADDAERQLVKLMGEIRRRIEKLVNLPNMFPLYATKPRENMAKLVAGQMHAIVQHARWGHYELTGESNTKPDYPTTADVQAPPEDDAEVIPLRSS